MWSASRLLQNRGTKALRNQGNVAVAAAARAAVARAAVGWCCTRNPYCSLERGLPLRSTCFCRTECFRWRGATQTKVRTSVWRSTLANRDRQYRCARSHGMRKWLPLWRRHKMTGQRVEMAAWLVRVWLAG